MRMPILAATAVLATALISGLPVAAQTSSGAGAGKAPAGQELKVTDAKLTAFIDAVIEVERVGASWKPKVAAAKSKAEAEKLMQSAHDEMRHAVETSPGITMAEYAAIASAAVEDPKLGAEVKSRLEAAHRKQ